MCWSQPPATIDDVWRGPTRSVPRVLTFAPVAGVTGVTGGTGVAQDGRASPTTLELSRRALSGSDLARLGLG